MVFERDPLLKEMHRCLVDCICSPSFAFALPQMDAAEWKVICSDPAARERLEFIGDSLIGTAISERLMQLFPSEAPGFYTRCRSVLVANATFAYLMSKAQVCRLDLNKGVKAAGDAFEAILALYSEKRGRKSFTEYVSEAFDPLVKVVGDAHHKNFQKLRISRHRHQLQVQRLNVAAKAVISSPVYRRHDIKRNMKSISPSLPPSNSYDLSEHTVTLVDKKQRIYNNEPPRVPHVEPTTLFAGPSKQTQQQVRQSENLNLSRHMPYNPTQPLMPQQMNLSLNAHRPYNPTQPLMKQPEIVDLTRDYSVVPYNPTQPLFSPPSYLRPGEYDALKNGFSAFSSAVVKPNVTYPLRYEPLQVNNRHPPQVPPNGFASSSGSGVTPAMQYPLRYEPPQVHTRQPHPPQALTLPLRGLNFMPPPPHPSHHAARAPHSPFRPSNFYLAKQEKEGQIQQILNAASSKAATTTSQATTSLPRILPPPVSQPRAGPSGTHKRVTSDELTNMFRMGASLDAPIPGFAGIGTASNPIAILDDD